MRILNKLFVGMGIYDVSPGNETRQRWFANTRAFTLLEVIVALAILAIALTTLFGAQSGSLSLATEAKFNTTAALLANLKRAELTSGRLAAVDAHGDFGKDFSGYAWKIKVRDAAGDLPGLAAVFQEGMHRIDLTITWRDTGYTYSARYYIGVEDVP